MSQSAVVGGPGGIDRVPLRSGSPGSVTDLVSEWEAYVEEKDDKWLVFLGDGPQNRDEIMTTPYSHRFTDEYTAMQYAKMQDFVRGAVAEYDDPHFTILTLTASTTTATGDLRPMLDHMDMVLSSWDRGVRYELNHVMDADREKDDYEPLKWEYLQIREPTTDAGRTPGGYCHIHPVIVTEGRPERERFEQVIDKHVEKCDWAELEAHGYEDAIETFSADEMVNPGAYLFKYLAKSWDSDMEPYQRRFNAMLWETGRRRFQPSDGAQRWMSAEESPGQSWIFAGVGEDHQVVELNEYDGAQDFRVAHEMGVRDWLNERETIESVDREAETVTEDGHVWLEETPGCDGAQDHEFERDRCIRCGLPLKALLTGVVPD